MTELEKDVHTEHCCFRHGTCKYGNSLCPVTSGAKKQSHPCEQCMDEAEKQEPWKSRLQALNEASASPAAVLAPLLKLARAHGCGDLIELSDAGDHGRAIRTEYISAAAIRAAFPRRDAAPGPTLRKAPPLKDVQCTCSYDDSEEMTSHAPLCATNYLRKVPCRKCGLADEMCLCVAKAYIADLEAKIEKLEDDDKPKDPAWKPVPLDPYALDLCQCNHERMHHERGTQDNNFDTKCCVDGCACGAYYRAHDQEGWKVIRHFLGDAAAQHQTTESLANRVIDMVKFYSKLATPSALNEAMAAFVKKHAYKVDSGTYGSGYRYCNDCGAVVDANEKHKPGCVVEIVSPTPDG